MAELLAPAGQPGSAHAAFHYGADAVYLGLSQFSARANAINFTPEELAGLVKHARALTPRRNVYLTLNTLLKDAELAAALHTLGLAVEAGADAVIVQDLGIAALVKRNFRHLDNFRLHASTQLAVHSPEGVARAAALGFNRITLARELTLKEIVACVETARRSGVEIETFIHGTLCYSYSGLCLFSGLTHSQSGNRGRCVYSCREAAEIREGKGRESGSLHPFSLKDLALKEKVLELAAAGVDSLKIEGRKKSPLYVAATVDYYRRLLDGRLGAVEKAAAENRLKTIFARPWTDLFFEKTFNPDAVDTEVVGHRGAPLGVILRLVNSPAGNAIAFRPGLGLERHDGLQIDLPGQERPYGFGVDRLFRLVPGGGKPPAGKPAGKRPPGEKGRAMASPERWEAVFAVEAGEEVAVPVPEDAPVLQPGQALYLASSQEVKRSYPYPTPKPDATGREIFLDVKIRLAASRENGAAANRGGRAEAETASAVIVCEAIGEVPAYARGVVPTANGAVEPDAGLAELSWREETLCEAFPARDAAGAEAAAQGALERMGESRFKLRNWEFVNPDRLFVKQGLWNRLRRDMTAELEKKYQKLRDDFLATLSREGKREIHRPAPETVAAGLATGPERSTSAARFAWSIAVDRLEQLEAFTAEELNQAEEIVVAAEADGTFPGKLAALRRRLGADGGKLRLALPILIRGRTAEWLAELITGMHERGFRRWLVPGLNGWGRWFGHNGCTANQADPDAGVGDGEPGAKLDLAADWPLYVTNRWSAAALLSRGFDYFTLSPEDEAENMRTLARLYPGRAVATVYAFMPLFISAACVHGLLQFCPGESQRNLPGNCSENVEVETKAGGAGGLWVNGGGQRQSQLVDINLRQNNYCSAKPLSLCMERGGAVQIVPASCGSVVRGEAPFVLTDKLDELWEMGVTRVRVDFRFSGKNSDACRAVWRSVREQGGGGPEGSCGNFRRGWR